MATIKIKNTVKGQSIKTNRKVGDPTISPLAYGESTDVMEIPAGKQLQVQVGYDKDNNMLTVGLFDQPHATPEMYYTNVSGKVVVTNTKVNGSIEPAATLAPGDQATGLMSISADANLTLYTAIFDINGTEMYTISTFDQD